MFTRGKPMPIWMVFPRTHLPPEIPLGNQGNIAPFSGYIHVLPTYETLKKHPSYIGKIIHHLNPLPSGDQTWHRSMIFRAKSLQEVHFWTLLSVGCGSWKKKVSFHYKLRFFRVKLLIFGVNPPCFPNFGEFNHHLVLHPSLGQGTTSSLALAAEPMAAETAPKLPERKTRRKCSDELFFDIFGYYCYYIYIHIMSIYI